MFQKWNGAVTAVFFLGLSLLGSSAQAARLKCSGTEPFWNVQVEDKSIRVELSGEKAVRYFGVQVREAAGVSPGYSFKVEGSRDKGARRVSLVVIRDSAESCSDGMSEEKLPYQVQVEVGGVLLSGCCS